jgi:hypothetical protein
MIPASQHLEYHLTQPYDELPARSRLFALKPIGLGTGRSEGLISYLIRLAGAHSVSPRRLIRSEFHNINPDSPRPWWDPFFTKNGKTVNGLNRYSRWFAETTAELTRVPDVRFLTLLPLQGLLPPFGMGLIVPHPRWCSSCFAAMRESRTETYQPLVWSFDLYRSCSIHQQPLIDRCPACGKHQYIFPSYPGIGFCTHCRGWLGRMQNDAPAAPPLVQWVAQALETIVAALPRLEALADRELFMRLVMEAVTRFADDNPSHFCRNIGLPQLSRKRWKIQNGRPSLPHWLGIAYGVGVGPVEFLEGAFRRFPEGSPLQKLPEKLEPRAERLELSASERENIEKEMNRIVAEQAGEVSIAMICRKFRLKRTYLIYHWPALCRTISSRHKETVRAKTRLKLAENCKKTEETVDALIEQGIYPGIRKMRAALNELGIALVEPVIWGSYKRQLAFRLQSQQLPSGQAANGESSS